MKTLVQFWEQHGVSSIFKGEPWMEVRWMLFPGSKSEPTPTCLKTLHYFISRCMNRCCELVHNDKQQIQSKHRKCVVVGVYKDSSHHDVCQNAHHHHHHNLHCSSELGQKTVCKWSNMSSFEDVSRPFVKSLKMRMTYSESIGCVLRFRHSGVDGNIHEISNMSFNIQFPNPMHI